MDPADIARFEAIGWDWWDPAGSMRGLHEINPLRIAWLRDLIATRLKTSTQEGEPPLTGVSILDIGCGAGLLAEPLARLGGEVTGLDPAPGNIEVARQHAAETGASLSYRAATVEHLAEEGASFDVVLAMEVVEHVRDMPSFVRKACGLVRPGLREIGERVAGSRREGDIRPGPFSSGPFGPGHWAWPRLVTVSR